MKDDDMACPDAKKVSQLLETPCRPEDEHWLESHFAACAECQRDLECSLEELHRSTVAIHELTLPLEMWQKLREFRPGGSEPSAFGSVEDVRLGPPRISEALGTLGPYDVFRELGHGGFGVVYLAHDPQVNRDFAVKVIWPKLAKDDRYLERFYEEARRSNEVKSPYVVSVIRVGRPPEFQLPCLVMEYVDGKSLRDVIKTQTSVRRRDSCRQWAAVVQNVAEGLHALHEKGIVHRDVKAANILLDQHTGSPKLTDFGLALDVARQGLSALVERAGTLPYMGPELVASGRPDRRKLPDRRSDVYSLGIVLYECLAGERPFRSDATGTLRRQILHDAPVPPRKRNDAVPRDLETITLKCLSKEPAQRYATAEALASDLGRFLANQPIHATPASPLRRVRLWCRRNPTGAVLIALAAVVLLFLTVAPWIYLHQVQTLRQETERERDRAVRSNKQRFETLEFVADTTIGGLPIIPETQSFRAASEEAILQHFRQAIDDCDDVTDAYYADACAMYAHYAQEFSRLEEARQYYAKAIAVYEALEASGDYSSLKDHAKFCLNLANVCHALGQKPDAFGHIARSLALWEELERRNSAAGPRREVGEVLCQRGHLKALDRQWQEALKNYRQAEERFRQLLQDSPDDPDLLSDLAGLKRNMGNAWDELGKESRSEEHARNARRSYEEAIALCQRVKGPAAQGPRFRDELAENYGALAVSAKQAGDTAAAKTAYEQSLGIRRGLVEQYPGDIPCLEGLARTLNNVACFYLNLKDSVKAREAFKEAVGQREQLVLLRPRDAEFRSSLGNTYLMASDLEIAHGDLKTALVLNDKSVAAAAEAFRLAPTHAICGLRLVTSLHGRGQLLEDCRDRPGAVEAYRKAIEVQTKLVDTFGNDARIRADLAALHHVLGQVLAEMKHSQEATEEFKAAADIWKAVGGAVECFRAAKCYARCAALASSDERTTARGPFVEQAIATLRQALNAGFNDRAALEKDDDFTEIRQEEGFQQLIKSLKTVSGEDVPPSATP